MTRSIGYNSCYFWTAERKSVLIPYDSPALTIKGLAVEESVVKGLPIKLHS